MNRTIAFLLVVATILLGLVTIQPVYSQTSQTIIIKPDGSVEPSTAAIHRVGQTYTFTANVKVPIILETDNIIVDGAGYSLQGSGSGVGLNMTCSNVTVENTHIVNWAGGILGVFNNNTIKNNLFTQCQSAMKVYAKYYVIEGNDIEKNNEGIRIGIGGYNFIAGNNITDNVVGLYLFDSQNVIMLNNISSSTKSAVILDNTGWSQTVYSNNFINNAKLLTDATYHSIQRPPQSSLPAWDNGSSGNYWSEYNGTDSNGDGIGDSSYEISTYYNDKVLMPYSFVDRYPLMKPFNTDSPIPPVPSSIIPVATPPSFSIPNDKTKPLSFLKDVLQLDLSRYSSTLTSDSVSGLSSETFQYTLYSSLNSASAIVSMSNNSIVSCNLFPTGLYPGHLLFTYPFSINTEVATRIMQNYQLWSNDTDVGKMVKVLNLAGSPNATQSAGNIDLNVYTVGQIASYKWSYNYYGAEYPCISLLLEQGSDYLTFSDSRTTDNIGNTTIGVSRQQAINIAQNCVRNYSYLLDFGNGTVLTVKDLNVNSTGTIANLATTFRDGELCPYWDVHVALDHIYLGETKAIIVQLWADNGTIFSGGEREVASSSTIPFSTFTAVMFTELLMVGTIIITILVAVLVIVLWVIFRKK